MKIEIDLNNILHDEDGVADETVQESIRRQVVERLASDVRASVAKAADAAVAEAIGDSIKALMQERVPALFEDLLDAEYTPVGRYGEKAAPTTVRKELHARIVEMAKFENRDFSSNETAFTKSVKAAVSVKMGEFQKEWTRIVDQKFLAEAMQHAATSLAKRAGIV